MAQQFNPNALKKSVVWSSGGTFYTSPLNDDGTPTGEWRSAGVVDTATLNIEVTNIEKKAPNFGVRQTVSKLVSDQTATLSMTVSEFDMENLTDSLYGTYGTLNEEAVVDEAHKMIPGMWVQLKRLVKYVDGSGFVATDEATGLITYVEGKHYIVDAAGAYIMTVEEQTAAGVDPGDIIPAEGVDALFNYTGEAVEVVQGFTETSNKKAVRFVGISLDDNKKYLITIPQVSFNPTDGMPFLAEEYGSMNLEGEVELSSAVATGESGFFTMQKVK